MHRHHPKRLPSSDPLPLNLALFLGCTSWLSALDVGAQVPDQKHGQDVGYVDHEAYLGGCELLEFALGIALGW